ncbi:hypothetical protein M2103_000603 [Ereboglobus sp. PH5-5]|uniref:hypothetical protein n=1 Tax=Ereboglobus sp. PH5-5 TaxID=2940529 RepID=UPI002406C1DC|nr:hypothetical protein [Ereboglobus sp. PH5-5]MDF9832393.1 hypothetical protein [Ereboglobus sp. PH5-5]
MNTFQVSNSFFRTILVIIASLAFITTTALIIINFDQAPASVIVRIMIAGLLFVPGISAIFGFVWLPVFIISRLFLRHRFERRKVPLFPLPAIIPPACFFVAALALSSLLLVRYNNNHRLRETVAQALRTPAPNAATWVAIPADNDKVPAQVERWLGESFGVPEPKLVELAENFSGNIPIAQKIVDQISASTRVLNILWTNHRSEAAGFHDASRNEPLRRLLVSIATHPEANETLACDIVRHTNDPAVRVAIGQHYGNSVAFRQKYLDILLVDSSPQSRRIAAGIVNISYPQMVSLASDPDPSVRARLASNPYLPDNLLRQLDTDNNIEVRRNLMLNPNVPAEWRDAYYREAIMHEDPEFRGRLVRENPDCPEFVLRNLANDEIAEVRAEVVNHSKTPMDVIGRLVNDKAAPVRTQAKMRMRDDLGPATY